MRPMSHHSHGNSPAGVEGEATIPGFKQESDCAVLGCGGIPFAWGVLLFASAVVFIVGWALSYESAWMLPEAFIWKSRIMLNVSSGDWNKLMMQFFDFQLFEYAPRTTRPLASAFEIVDTVFRANLWKIVTPHPSLSLSWLFTLCFGPWFLYRLLIVREVPQSVILCVLGVYLTQMGTLSNVVVLFRSAKPVALFFMIFCWFLAEILVRRGFRWSTYTFLLFCLTISFLFDESTALTYVIVGLLLSKTLFRRPGAAVLYTFPALCYALGVFWLIPWLSSTLGFSLSGGERAALTSYAGQLDISGLLSGDFIYNLALNAWVVIRESLCLHNPLLMEGYGGTWVITIHIAFTILLGLVLVRDILQKASHNTLWSVYTPLATVCGFILIAIIFHGAMMYIVVNKIWGPFYYGAYSGVLLVILSAELCKLGGGLRTVTYLWMASLMAASMVTFPAMNMVYKRFHYYPYRPLEIVEYFRGNANRFTISKLESFGKNNVRELAAYQWRDEGVHIRIPKESLWVLIEMGKFGNPKGFLNTELSQSWNVVEYDIYRNGFRPATFIQ